MTTPVQIERLTGDRALELLRRAVEEKGAEYVYVNPKGQKAGSAVPCPGVQNQLITADCRYVHGDTPGCIAGHVLHWAGVPLFWLQPWEGAQVSLFVQEGGWANEEAAVVLQAAQSAQDSGETWGRALERAEEALAHLRAAAEEED